VCVVGIVLFAVASVAIVSFTAFAQRRAKDSSTWSIINKLWSYAQAAVAHGEAELRPKIQAALADGQLTATEAKELKVAVVDIFKQMAGDELGKLQGLLGMEDGPFAVFISGLIENAVSVLKPSGLPAAGSEAGPTPPAIPPMKTVVKTGVTTLNPLPPLP
jgi:hypothetical protein